jgi:hypothetical protein
MDCNVSPHLLHHRQSPLHRTCRRASKTAPRLAPIVLFPSKMDVGEIYVPIFEPAFGVWEETWPVERRGECKLPSRRRRGQDVYRIWWDSQWRVIRETKKVLIVIWTGGRRSECRERCGKLGKVRKVNANDNGMRRKCKKHSGEEAMQVERISDAGR